MFVRAPADVVSEQAVRELVFHHDAAIPKLIAHDGRYWSFDTAGIRPDGTL